MFVYKQYLKQYYILLCLETIGQDNGASIPPTFDPLMPGQRGNKKVTHT